MTTFPREFESAFGRLQVTIEEACAGDGGWPERAAEAIRSAFALAAAEPEVANVLTNAALAAGPDGIRRHRRLVAYMSELLEPGRRELRDPHALPEILERALAAGLVFLVAQRLDRGRASELPALAAEAVEFVLTPYVGAGEARRIASR